MLMKLLSTYLLKQQISRVFAPHIQAYRVLSRSLSASQGRNEILNYVQELRNLITAMQPDPLPDMVLGTSFMEGIRTGVARTEVFRVQTTFFETNVYFALSAEFNFEVALFGNHGYNPNSANSFSSPNRPEPPVLFASPIHTNSRASIVENIVIFDDVSREEEQGIYSLICLYIRHARILQAELPSRPRTLVRREST